MDNISLFDQWTIWHILGGLVVGFYIYNKVKKSKRFEYSVGIPILFELVEQNIVASWMKIIPLESLGNSIVDIIVGIIVINYGIKLAKKK